MLHRHIIHMRQRKFCTIFLVYLHFDCGPITWGIWISIFRLDMFNQDPLSSPSSMFPQVGWFWEVFLCCLTLWVYILVPPLVEPFPYQFLQEDYSLTSPGWFLISILVVFIFIFILFYCLPSSILLPILCFCF